MNHEAAISSLLEYIKRTLIYNLDNSNFLFLTKKLSPFDNYKVTSNTKLQIIWHSNGKLEKLEKPYRSYTDKYTRGFTLKGNIWFKSLDTGLVVEKKMNEKLAVDAILNFNEHEFTFEIINEDKKLLKELHAKVIQTSKKQNLFGFDDYSIKIDNKAISSFYTEIIRKPREKGFDFFKDYNIYADLTRVSQDIRFLLGQLILYKPYITNYLSGKTNWNGKIVFRYFPNMYDKRYFMNSGLIISLLYNYWDKIGDLLDLCFDVLNNKRKVYFGAVIDKFPTQYSNSQNYLWLKNFKDNEFTDLLKKRNDIVHYSALESRYFEQYQDKNKNEQEIIKLQKEKEELVEYLVNHNRLMYEGFEKALKLIDEIS